MRCLAQAFDVALIVCVVFSSRPYSLVRAMSSQRELQNVKMKDVQDSQDMFEVYKEEMMNPASEDSPKTPNPYEKAASQEPAAPLCEALEKAGVTAAETRAAGCGVSVVTDERAVHSTEEDCLPCPQAMEISKHMAKKNGSRFVLFGKFKQADGNSTEGANSSDSKADGDEVKAKRSKK